MDRCSEADVRFHQRVTTFAFACGNWSVFGLWTLIMVSELWSGLEPDLVKSMTGTGVCNGQTDSSAQARSTTNEAVPS